MTAYLHVIILAVEIPFLLYCLWNCSFHNPPPASFVERRGILALSYQHCPKSRDEPTFSCQHPNLSSSLVL